MEKQKNKPCHIAKFKTSEYDSVYETDIDFLVESPESIKDINNQILDNLPSSYGTDIVVTESFGSYIISIKKILYIKDNFPKLFKIINLLIGYIHYIIYSEQVEWTIYENIYQYYDEDIPKKDWEEYKKIYGDKRTRYNRYLNSINSTFEQKDNLEKAFQLAKETDDWKLKAMCKFFLNGFYSDIDCIENYAYPEEGTSASFYLNFVWEETDIVGQQLKMWNNSRDSFSAILLGIEGSMADQNFLIEQQRGMENFICGIALLTDRLEFYVHRP